MTRVRSLADGLMVQNRCHQRESVTLGPQYLMSNHQNMVIGGRRVTSITAFWNQNSQEITNSHNTYLPYQGIQSRIHAPIPYISEAPMGTQIY